MLLQGNQGQIGKQVGQNITAGMGEFSDLLFSELQGRYYEQCYRGNIFSAGLSTLTSIAAATFSTADILSGTLATAATGTPIIGLWNPTTSGYNAAIVQANMQLINTALQQTGPGAFMWCVFTGQAAITVANQQTPVNHKTFVASGSQMKGLCTLALTGLTTTGLFLRAANFSTSLQNLSTLQTAAGFATSFGPQVEQIDGSIIVPPGGILALACTSTPVAYSVVPSISWVEVPA